MRAALLLALMAVAWSAEPPAPPDPLGLGERLALIEALRARGETVAPGAGEDELRRRWAALWAAAGPATAAAQRPGDDEAVARLRRQIRERYRHEPDPALDRAGLEGLREQLERQAQARDQQEQDPAPARAAGPLPQPVQRPAPATAGTPAPARSAVERIPFAAVGVDHAELRRGLRTSLSVQFGGERAGEFRGVFATLHALLESSPHIPDAVFLLGHGGGVTINGTEIDDHLRKHKEFYETFGGTRPARPLACLVIASCARGSPDQMVAMRDGLGYYPTWRVGTWTRSYANAWSVIGAFEGIVRRPADPAWRGLFLTDRADGAPASLGEAGHGGERGNLVYLDLVVDGGKRTWRER